MRLFYQLTIEEKEVSVKHCLYKIINDLLVKKIEIQQLLDNLDLVFLLNDSEELAVDHELLNNFNQELAKAQDLPSYQEKCDALMKNEQSAYILMEAASSLAEKTYYHDPDENIIYPDILMENFDETEEDDGEEENINDAGNKDTSLN